MMWAAVLGGSLLAYALKILGFALPGRVLDRPLVRRIAGFLPIAMLAALVSVQTFASGSSVGVDARLAGLTAAVIALVLRAPFLVVVVVAAVTAAVLRALGWLP